VFGSWYFGAADFGRNSANRPSMLVSLLCFDPFCLKCSCFYEFLSSHAYRETKARAASFTMFLTFESTDIGPSLSFSGLFPFGSSPKFVEQTIDSPGTVSRSGQQSQVAADIE
jgi:hypothetical protein